MNALLVVDIQHDFLPGGSLAVPDGDAVIPVTNQLMEHFDLVVATQDWHPAHHKSFASNHKGRQVGDVIEWQGISQVLWPDHCVQNSHGAAFATDLNSNRFDKVFQKGLDPDVDSYSGFFDNGGRNDSGLGTFLKSKAVNHLTIVGLATDYCVKFTALDARKLGFEVTLDLAGCRGVNLNEGDVAKALREMEEAGVSLSNTSMN